MTKDQVYAAKKMYALYIRSEAIELNCAIDKDEPISSVVAKIMKKTSSEFIIKKVLRFYAHYVQMNLRLDKQIWEEEEE